MLLAEGQVLALVQYFLDSFYKRARAENVKNLPGTDRFRLTCATIAAHIGPVISCNTAFVGKLCDDVPLTNCKGAYAESRLKKDSEGEIEKHKARVVAKGFNQKEGVDYHETFAPVLAIAARNGWKIDTFDFHSAFLNGEFGENEEIYMEQPPGYEEENRREYVLRLLKTIYGLRQASRKWYEIVCRLMTELGFTRSESDPAVFYWHEGNDRMVIVVHVDDCTIVGNSQELIDDCKRKINAKYAMTDLGPTSWVLGIRSFGTSTNELSDFRKRRISTQFFDDSISRT